MKYINTFLTKLRLPNQSSNKGPLDLQSNALPDELYLCIFFFFKWIFINVKILWMFYCSLIIFTKFIKLYFKVSLQKSENILNMHWWCIYRNVVKGTKTRGNPKFEKMKICAPNVGLEPTTLRLRVSCSTDWASQALLYCGYL